MPDGEDSRLQDHLHTPLRHLPPILHPRKPPALVPNDQIYNDTRQAYNYPQHIRTMAHIRGDHADNTLMSKKKCFSFALRHTLVVLEMH